MTRHVLFRLLIALLIAPWSAVLMTSPAQAAAQPVMISGYAFQPAQLTIHVGDSVTWTNHDQAPHDATATNGPVMFQSPTLSTGQSWTYTFTKPGTYSYYCSIHPSMRAQIVVQPAATDEQQPNAQSTATSGARPPAQRKTQAPTRASQPPETTESPAVAEAPPSDNAGPPPETQQGTPQTAQAVAPAAQTTLNPMLLMAGLVAAISVLCLLLIGSRPNTDADDKTP